MQKRNEMHITHVLHSLDIQDILFCDIQSVKRTLELQLRKLKLIVRFMIFNSFLSFFLCSFGTFNINFISPFKSYCNKPYFAVGYNKCAAAA